MAEQGAVRNQEINPDVAGLIWAMLDVADAIREQSAALIDFMGNTGVRTVDMGI
jgi:hypothetical protein